MAYPTLCSIIAYFFAIMSGLGIPFSGFFLVAGLHKYGQIIKTTNNTFVIISASTIANLLHSFASVTVVFIASVYLIMGIRNKHHRLVAPWVYIIPITTALNLLKLIWFHEHLISPIITTVIFVACWFPVFCLYRELRALKFTQPPENHPLNNGCNAYPLNVREAGFAFSPPGPYPPQTQAVYNPLVQPLYPVPSAHIYPAPNVNYPSTESYEPAPTYPRLPQDKN